MKIPTVRKLLTSYKRTHGIFTRGVTAEELFTGNCHSVAIECAKLMGHPARQVRGHWIGIGGVQQHSWVECGNSWIDPTRFVFECEEAYVWVGLKGDKNYDLGSFKLREMARGNSGFPSREKPFKCSLSTGAGDAINRAFGIENDWSQWSIPEMFRIANTDPQKFGEFGLEIFTAIHQKNRAIIPIDTQDYLSLS